MCWFGRGFDCSVDVHQLGQEKEHFQSYYASKPVKYFKVFKCEFCSPSMHLNTSRIGLFVSYRIIASRTLKSTNDCALIGSCSFELKCPNLRETFFFFWMKKRQSWWLFLFLWRKHLKDCPPLLLLHGLHYWQLYKYSLWSIYVWVQCSIKLGIVLLHSFSNSILFF